MVSVTGTEDTPSKAGISIADIAAGMYTYTGVLTALIARSKTGKGAVIEVSMLEALAEWMGFPLYYSAYGEQEPKRTGASHATIYPYGPFKAGDEKFVFMGIQNEREWVRFCEEVLKKPEVAVDSRFDNNSKRVVNKEALKEIIENVFQQSESLQIIELLESAKIANARLNTLKELVDHPQLQARNRWSEVDSPVGPLKALIPPVTSDEISSVMKPIPEVGQHTEAILKEFGFDPEKMQASTSTDAAEKIKQD
nr:CaiB/BaiF CoA-transferase family protein [Planococcus glaciei]